MTEANRAFGGTAPSFAQTMYQVITNVGVVAVSMVAVSESEAVVLVHAKSIVPTKRR